MAEKNFYEDSDPVTRLRLWGLGQMMWGGLIAGVVVLGILVFLVAIWAVGELLPPESKEAPSPYGSLHIVQPVRVA